MAARVDEHEFLKRGDALLKVGDKAGAIEQYLVFCHYMDHANAVSGHAPPTLRRCAVKKQILELDPARRDLRRSLAEDYVLMDLIDDAKSELARVADEAQAAGDPTAHDEAIERLRELSK